MNRTRSMILAASVFVGSYMLGRMTTTADESRIVDHGRMGHAVVHHASSMSVRSEDLAKARAALDQGMADGVWSEEDRDRIRPLFQPLGRAEGEQIFSTLIPAMNAGRVKLSYRGAPI